MCRTAIQLHGWKGNIYLRFIFNFHTENVFCAKHVTKNIKGGIFLQISYLYLDICFIFYSLLGWFYVFPLWKPAVYSSQQTLPLNKSELWFVLSFIMISLLLTSATVTQLPSQSSFKLLSTSFFKAGCRVIICLQEMLPNTNF